MKTNDFLKQHIADNECCPYCGADCSHIEGQEVNINGPFAEQQCTCSACRCEWIDVYELALVRECEVDCKFCGEITNQRKAHWHDGGWVCEKCWDERLKEKLP